MTDKAVKNENFKKIIEDFYKRTGIYNVKIEFGTFGKWKNYTVKVTYSKNNVHEFTDFFTDEDIEQMKRALI